MQIIMNLVQSKYITLGWMSLAILILLIVSTTGNAETTEAKPADVETPSAAVDSGSGNGSEKENRSLDSDVQSLKKEVLELNRDLFVLEEELLFPANTQVAVFVSMDIGDFFALDSVQVKIDDKVVSNYLYTEREVEALFRGGVQRIYTGNHKAGSHELVAFFVGKGPHDRDYKRAVTLQFAKESGPKFIELIISDSENKLQPEFKVKQWQ